MRTSTDFGMVWFAAATAALGICVPAQGQEPAVWNPDDEDAKPITALINRCIYTGGIGNTVPTMDRIESGEPLAFTWRGLLAQGDSVVNTGVISHRIDEKVSASADATMKLHVGVVEHGKYYGGESWKMDHWNIPNQLGGEVAFLPYFDYTYRQDVVLAATGITVEGGTGENRGRIDIGASLHADLSARAAFEFSTKQSVPTEEQVKAHGEDGFAPIDWIFTPKVSSKAVVQLTMTLAGMSARSIPGVAATAVNSGEIVVDGRVTRTTEIEEPSLKGVENFKAEDDTGHYIALTFDTSRLTASAGFNGTAEVFGMVGSSGVEKEEEEGQTPVVPGGDTLRTLRRTSAVPSAEGDGSSESGESGEDDEPELPAAPPAPVYLINNGTITLSASGGFVGAGIAAYAYDSGTVWVQNHGRIDVSGIDVSDVEDGRRHQFVGSIEDSGTVVMGDWLLSTDDLRNDDIVPLALSVGKDATGKLTFAPGATLMIVPLHRDDLEGELTLNPVLGVYDADDVFSTNLSEASGIEGTFAAVGTGSTMLSLAGGSPDLDRLNNLTVSFAVHPERSLGTDVRDMSFTAHWGAVHSALTLTGRGGRSGEAGLTLIPWYGNLQTSGRRGFEASGGGLILKAATAWGERDAWYGSAHVGLAHRSVDGDHGTAEASVTHTTVGAALSRRLGERFEAGARFEFGRESADWTVHDLAGSSEASPDVTSFYGDVHVGASVELTDAQTLTGRVAFGWMKMKQDAFDLNTFGTGFVAYDAGTVETPVVSLEADWRMETDVSGYRVVPRVGVGLTYLTDPEWDADFAYLGHRYEADGELDHLWTTLTAGFAFGRGPWSIGLEGTGRWSSASSGFGMNARLRWVW